MKKTLMVLLGTICSFTYAQLTQDIVDAMTWGAKTKITLRIVDSIGMPVAKAQINIGWSYDYTNRHREKKLETNQDGLIVLDKKSRGTFTYFIEKEGYYKSSGR